ncbi:MAG: hypothetical protein K2K39_01075, partial [Clostridia bacterium]|nr:hypothetical protein [Clostridia bacterium]
MDVLMYALGIVLAAVVLAAALLLTVGLYLNYCSRHPSRKFRAEVFVILTVTVLSLVVRVAIGIATLPENSLAGGVKSFLHALFSAVAGLTFNSLLELGDMQMVNGILASLYYGIIVYASLVFLIVVTVGLSYEFYSRVQMRGLRRRYSCYYIFTAITPDSIILAQDIKRREEKKQGSSKRRKNFAIIFFEDGQESFSRKNALHRVIMENGFFYYSDFRRTDRGEVVSFLQTFKFRQKDVKGDDNGENRNKLFYVFATGDCGGFEGDNGELVFEDLTAVLKRYVRVDKDGNLINGIPTAVNYFLLTGGEINYESYEFRLHSTVSEHLKSIGINADKKLTDEIKKSLQVNVFNEATLSSQNMVERRKRNLSSQSAGAFNKDILPDGDGVYRIAVLGFGKTGQYAMEELYVQSAHLESKDGKYIPARFIADVYDPTADDKSGLFAYNHPLIRCINEETAELSPAKKLLSRADSVEGQAFDALYGEYSHLSGASREEAKRYVDENMQFPVVAFHAKSGFTYPFMDSESADAAVNEAVKNNVRAFVVALGDDERDIAMANVLIDAFKRAYVLGGALPERRVAIYVNLIECRSAGRLN